MFLDIYFPRPLIKINNEVGGILWVFGLAVEGF